MVLGSIMPLTKMSTRNLTAGKKRSPHKARLTTLWASTACYRDSFTVLEKIGRLIFGVLMKTHENDDKF
jgi:hypothetical protein